MTETWLRDGPELEKDREDLSEGAGLGMVVRNRSRPAGNGVTYGGVAVLWRENFCTFKKVDCPNPSDFEVLVCAGSIPGHSRKMVVIARYLPPNYTRTRAAGAMEYIGDIVTDMKRRFSDPFIIIAGDFNQWKIDEALLDFVDIKEVLVGNTRKDKAIDRFFTNMTRSVKESGALEPLETESEIPSDHRVAFCRLSLPRVEAFTWESYTYRHFNKESVDKFKEWLVMHDWPEVLTEEGSTRKAEAYQATITWALQTFFPLKTTRKKSTSLPWMNSKIRKLISDRKKLYLSKGGKRTAVWKAEKKRVADIIKE